MEARLSGRTILVVEDEVLIALGLEAMLKDAGAKVRGPAHSEAEAMAVIDAAVREAGTGIDIDAAILDVHLGERTCETVALRLLGLGVPFVLHSGHARIDEPVVKRTGAPLLQKPAPPTALVAVLARMT